MSILSVSMQNTLSYYLSVNSGKIYHIYQVLKHWMMQLLQAFAMMGWCLMVLSVMYSTPGSKTGVWWSCPSCFQHLDPKLHLDNEHIVISLSKWHPRLHALCESPALRGQQRQGSDKGVCIHIQKFHWYVALKYEYLGHIVTNVRPPSTEQVRFFMQTVAYCTCIRKSHWYIVVWLDLGANFEKH